MATFQDYVGVLKSGTIKQRIKIEWLRPDESVESEMIEDILNGSLTINRNNGVRRAIEFTVKNSLQLLPNIYGIWVNKKLKLSLGIETANGEDYFIPQGVFILSNPNYVSSPSGSEVTFSAIDKFGALNGESGKGLLQDIYMIPSGSNINFAVSKILTDFKDFIPPILRPSTMTFPYTIRKGQGENVGEMLKDVAFFSARNIFYDTSGILVFDDDTSDDTKPSLWNFNSQDDKYCYLGSSMENKFSDIRNVVKVIGDNSSPTGLIAVGIAKDTDLSSPSNINLLGEIPDIVQNNYIRTNADALRLAEYKLKRLKILNSAITIESIPILFLDVDSMVTITDENYNIDNQRFLIQSINIDLSVGGKMSLSCVKADEEDYTVGKVD